MPIQHWGRSETGLTEGTHETGLQDGSEPPMRGVEGGHHSTVRSPIVVVVLEGGQGEGGRVEGDPVEVERFCVKQTMNSKSFKTKN